MTEIQIHRLIVARLRLARVTFFHLHNPGAITPAHRNRIRAMGASSPKGHPLLGGTGVPDLVIVTPPPCGGYVAAALELKAEGGKLSLAQRDWLARMRANGWATGTAWGEAEALVWLRGLGYGVGYATKNHGS